MARSRSDNISNKKMFIGGGRDYAIDILRCLSCLMVVTSHVFAFFLDENYSILVDPGSTQHYVALFFRCLTTSATDIFLMISGVFFLSPERNMTPRKIWGKNILKMTTALALWLILYGMFETIESKEHFDMETVIYNVIHHEMNHLWYIPMMIGVYILVPLFRVFTENAKRFHYHYLFALVAIVSMVDQLYGFNKGYNYNGAEEINIIINRTPYQYMLSLFVLPIIGYWLYTARTKRSFRCLLYVLGVAGVVMLLIMEINIYKQSGTLENAEILGKIAAGNFFKCIGIFLFITTVLDGLRLKGIARTVIMKLSGATLFIYLSHWMGIMFLLDRKLLLNGFGQSHVVLTAIIYILLIYIAGFFFSVVFLQSIPWIGIRNKIFDAIAPNRTIYVTKKK